MEKKLKNSFATHDSPVVSADEINREEYFGLQREETMIPSNHKTALVMELFTAVMQNRREPVQAAQRVARMIDHIRASLEKSGTTVHAADIIAAAEVLFDECPVERADREMFLEQMRGALEGKVLRVG